jgi:hypothetical protein
MSCVARRVSRWEMRQRAGVSTFPWAVAHAAMECLIGHATTLSRWNFGKIYRGLALENQCAASWRCNLVRPRRYV